MEGKTLVHIGAVVFVAVALTATAIELTRPTVQMEASARPTVEPSIDPLASELMRCQGLGEAGPRDIACRAAWSESRERFLTPGAQSSQLNRRATGEQLRRNETIVPKNAEWPVLEDAAPVTAQDGSP
jgi:conjugative transfer region protein TrbK